MCTTNAKFLERPIPEVEGWKVLTGYFSNDRALHSPVFFRYNETPWRVGERRSARLESFHGALLETCKDPHLGFHIFKYRISAWLWCRSFPPDSYCVIRRVRGYNVRAQGRVSGGLLPIYIAQEAELL